MSLKAESLSCWPQFSSKSCNILFLCPREHMYFHNDQKIGWEREPARTICTEFFSVRRNLWRHYSFIMQASTGQQLTSAKRCSACSRTVRILNADCPRRPFLCFPSTPTPKGCSRQTYGSHWGLLLPFRCPSHVDNQGFTTAQNGVLCFLLGYSKFGAC